MSRETSKPTSRLMSDAPISARNASKRSRTRHKTRFPGIYYREDAQDLRRYIVWYEDALGKGRTLTLPRGSTLEDAKHRQAELRAQKAKGERIVPTKQTVGSLLDQWLDRRAPSLKPGTLRVYTWGVERAKKDVGTIRVTELTADTLVALRQRWIAEGYKKHTISKIETPLRMALKAAARDGFIAASPYDKLLSHEAVKSDQKEMRCLSSDEIQRLLKNAGQWKTLFAFLCLTGVRISEALQLRWEDVQLPGKSLDSHSTGGLIGILGGKTAAARREVILVEALCGLLRAWKLKQAPGVELVFPFPYRTVHSALRRAEDAAGLPHYRIHELRHTFASILIGQGEDVIFVCKQMGHANPKTTLSIYGHLFDAQDRTARARERLQEVAGGLL